MERKVRKVGVVAEARAGEEVKEKAVKLDLSGMSLDSIPNPSINLSNITMLDLYNNNLESIPESLIARLLSLVVLDVHSNQLRALPNSIGCLYKLKVLNISGNLIETLPKTIESCRALEELIANFNKLTKLPDSIGFELTKLRKLSVNSNKLAFLPYSTSHLTSLQVLDARLNCLRSLPDGLENLIRLEKLNISQNFQYLQSLPYSIGLLISLVELDISYNKITVLPESMGCLAKLTKFHAEGNPLVSPPMDVVEQRFEVVREYLCARMKGTESSGPCVKKRSWFGKLVKNITFSAEMAPSHSSWKVEDSGFFLSEYRSVEGFASPRHVGSIFSPKRLFSPSRASTKK